LSTFMTLELNNFISINDLISSRLQVLLWMLILQECIIRSHLQFEDFALIKLFRIWPNHDFSPDVQASLFKRFQNII
jgi:hypothetical protein